MYSLKYGGKGIENARPVVLDIILVTENYKVKIKYLLLVSYVLSVERLKRNNQDIL